LTTFLLFNATAFKDDLIDMDDAEDMLIGLVIVVKKPLLCWMTFLLSCAKTMAEVVVFKTERSSERVE